MSAASSRTSDGIRVVVRATPRGGRDAVEGVQQLADGRAALCVRVRAAPADGAANEALRRCLAEALGCTPSAITVAAGATSRLKTLTVRGDPEALANRLDAIAAREDRP